MMIFKMVNVCTTLGHSCYIHTNTYKLSYIYIDYITPSYTRVYNVEYYFSFNVCGLT